MLDLHNLTILVANLISTTEESKTAAVEGCSALRGKSMEKSSHREMEETVQFAELGKGIGKEKDIENGTKQGNEGNDVSLIIYSCPTQLLTNP